MFKIKVITPNFIVLLGLIFIINQTNAECCRGVIVLHNPNNKEIRQLCADGTVAPLFFCGIGRCNWFGCECNGGCRQNSYGYDHEEAKRLYHIKTS